MITINNLKLTTFRNTNVVIFAYFYKLNFSIYFGFDLKPDHLNRLEIHKDCSLESSDEIYFDDDGPNFEYLFEKRLWKNKVKYLKKYHDKHK
jgi:hypothetical protein